MNSLAGAQCKRGAQLSKVQASALGHIARWKVKARAAQEALPAGAVPGPMHRPLRVEGGEKKWACMGCARTADTVTGLGFWCEPAPVMHARGAPPGAQRDIRAFFGRAGALGRPPEPREGP